MHRSTLFDLCAHFTKTSAKLCHLNFQSRIASVVETFHLQGIFFLECDYIENSG